MARGFGSRLRTFRDAKDLTQKQLGEVVGVHESTISLWETDKREPDMNQLAILASYFDTTCDYLILGYTPSSYMAEIEVNWPGLAKRLKAAAHKVDEKDKERIKRTIDMYLEGDDK
ncbi:MAG: helix-turn-helix domain-containing protein [Ignavibacteriales bacterium]